MDLLPRILLMLLFIDLLPLYIVVILSVWRFCYLWMPIDLLLHFEEGLGELHPLQPSYITSQIQVYKGVQRPCKTSGIGNNTVNTTVPSSTDNDSKYPEPCSDDNEDGMGTGSAVECHGGVDKSQLVVTVGSEVECHGGVDKSQLMVIVPSVQHWYNTRSSVAHAAVPEQQSNAQVSPPVAVPKQSTSQVATPAVREVCPPTGKEINQPTIQEIQLPCNTRYQDGSDDSDSEDEELAEDEDREADVPHDCDYQGLEEKMIFQGALLCSSDTKIDQAGKSEEMTVMVEEGCMMMAVNNNFASHVGSTKEVDQACIGDEIKNDNNKESTTTVSSNSAYTQSADDVVSEDTEEGTNEGTDEDTTDDDENDMLPDPMSPND